MENLILRSATVCVNYAFITEFGKDNSEAEENQEKKIQYLQDHRVYDMVC